MTTRLTTVIIIFNVLMSLLLVFFSELLLIGLQGQALTVNVFTIDHQPIGYPPIDTVTEPIPNYPVFVFLFALVVNIYFMVKQRRNKTEPS